MSDENKINPKFEFKSIKLGESQEITLDCAKAVKTGESQYGTWNMWFGFVENATVYHGKKPNITEETGYSGKVILFPAKKLNENLEKAANGNTGVKVKITKTAEEGAKGLITNYVVEKLSNGEAGNISSQLTPSEMSLINETQDIKADGYTITEEIFINQSKDPSYKGKISLERAKELYKIFQNM